MLRANAVKGFLSALFLVLLSGLGGCSGGGGEPAPLPATVSGRVVSDAGDPIADVVVLVDAAAGEALTDEGGRFALEVAAGRHRLTASKGDASLGEICFTAADGVSQDLGDIDPTTPANCLSAAPGPGDADGDGLLDADEKAGWMVNVVLGDGSVERHAVTSDPAEFDTDGDGLSDAEERAARTDPRRGDTDGDLLSDYAELQVYKSHPNRMDSDGDSCDPDPLFDLGGCDSDPNLWDGYELALSKTSPTLADTDGDGLSDYQEINVGGTHPLIADLPELSLTLNGEPSIILNITDNEEHTSKTVTSSLVRDTAEQKRSARVSADLTIENTTKIKAEAGAGKSLFSVGAKTSNETTVSLSLGLHAEASWSKESVQETQEEYARQVGNETKVSFDDGMLWQAIKLSNRSNLAFKLKDLKVIAYRMETGSSFSTVGTLVPGYKSKDGGDRDIWVKDPLCADPVDSTTCGRVLGPRDELTLVVGADSLPAQIMRALVKNPTALRFEVASYSLFQLDDWGVEETVNYAKVGERVAQRCGLLAVDHGNGEVENLMIATNVHRHADGSGRGVTLREALGDIAVLDYATVRTDGDEPGSEKLLRIKNTWAYDKCDSSSPDYDPAEDCENRHRMGLWLVGGSDRQFDDNAPPVDFNELVLNNGQQINLVYLQDSDGEGIFDREEYLLGTDKTLPDSDYDGLDDYTEAKEGWQVAVSGKRPYHVYPDPRFSDVDGDALSDSGERGLGTDPYKADTDGDGAEGGDDFYDTDPLNPPCLDGDQLGLVSWWDGTVGADDVVIDLMGNNDGELVNGAETLPLNDGMVFALNRDNNINNQSIRVANSTSLDAHNNVYTFAARINWKATANTTDYGTILAKGLYPDPGETYALYIFEDGHLHHVLKRNYLYQCGEGILDPFCKDYYKDRREYFNTAADVVQHNEWVQVVGTFDRGTARIYVDGVERASKSLGHTRKLITNDNYLWIGGREGSTVPFKGMMDDIQFFNRALNAEQVRQLNQIGVCQP
ncbi:MAG TPA: hypothetical protein ENJ17_04200 [Gammaproteobacteria bacterium]|nr:hypothetical protein [Gammaproteobacteria bacterium]